MINKRMIKIKINKGLVKIKIKLKKKIIRFKRKELKKKECVRGEQNSENKDK